MTAPAIDTARAAMPKGKSRAGDVALTIAALIAVGCFGAMFLIDWDHRPGDRYRGVIDGRDLPPSIWTWEPRR